MFSFRKLLFPILYFRKWKKNFFNTNYHLFFLIQSHICRVQSDLDLILDHFLTKWSDRRSLYCNTPDRDLDLILDHFLTKWSWTDRRSEKKWSCNSLDSLHLWECCVCANIWIRHDDDCPSVIVNQWLQSFFHKKPWLPSLFKIWLDWVIDNQIFYNFSITIKITTFGQFSLDFLKNP